MRPRATPMAPEQRRAALVEATLPLLREHGREISTRRIAEAAGVAEGTIFRVFATKDELIDAATASVFDPGPLLRRLADIDPAEDLRTRLVTAVAALQDHLRSLISLMTAMRMTRPPTRPGDDRHPGPGHGPWSATARDATERITAAFEDLIAPDAADLRLPPREAAQAVRLLAFSATHPMIANPPLSAGRVTDLILDGVRRRPTAPGDPTGADPADPGGTEC